MENVEKMNLYKKINAIKIGLLKKSLKKSGKNKFANFEYYELSDILPSIIELCNEQGVMTSIRFSNEEATLTIIDCDFPDLTLCYSSPMRTLELKGCNEIQALGGVETYQRRYLYMNAFDIVENDMFDGNVNNPNRSKQPVSTRPPVKENLITDYEELKESLLLSETFQQLIFCKKNHAVVLNDKQKEELNNIYSNMKLKLSREDDTILAERMAEKYRNDNKNN